MRDYQGHFEVHITVRALEAQRLHPFRAWCAARGRKCISIVLARGAHVEQPMASWRRSAATLPIVLAEAQACARELEQAGFDPVRVKIEADPHNHDVPLHDAEAAEHNAENYFEHHVKLLRAAAAERAWLMQVCGTHGAHLSRNALRETADGQEERFVTLRCYRAGRTTAEGRLQALLGALHSIGERIVEIESEYTVHDSNLGLDAGWLDSQTP
jgi:hypothetical protein